MSRTTVTSPERVQSLNGAGPSAPVYQVHGAGEPLVYVCGIEGTGLNFFKQLPDLVRDHAVLTFPHRPTGRYNLDQLVDDIRCTVSHAGFERATFIGESFGGLLVQALALAHPQLVKRMILVNTFASFLHPLKVKAGLALYACVPLSWINAYRSRRSGSELFSEDIGAAERAQFLRNTCDVSVEGYRARLRIIRDTNLLPKLHLIDIPALIVSGSVDGMLDAVASGRAMAERLPRSKLKVLEGTGHMALLSNRVRVRDLLEEVANL